MVLLVILDETDKGISSEVANLASQMFEKILPALGIYPDSNVNQNVPSPNANNSSIDLGNSQSTTGDDSGSSDDSSDQVDDSSDEGGDDLGE